jgi:hypothetical protein
MRERGQATAEYAGIGLLVLALLLGAATAARGQLTQPASDVAYLDQARQVAPLIVPERGDDEVLPHLPLPISVERLTAIGDIELAELERRTAALERLHADHERTYAAVLLDRLERPRGPFR